MCPDQMARGRDDTQRREGREAGDRLPETLHTKITREGMNEKSSMCVDGQREQDRAETIHRRKSTQIN